MLRRSRRPRPGARPLRVPAGRGPTSLPAAWASVGVDPTSWTLDTAGKKHPPCRNRDLLPFPRGQAPTAFRCQMVNTDVLHAIYLPARNHPLVRKRTKTQAVLPNGNVLSFTANARSRAKEPSGSAASGRLHVSTFLPAQANEAGCSDSFADGGDPGRCSAGQKSIQPVDSAMTRV